MKYHDLSAQIMPLLHTVRRPGRYVGGEYGAVSKRDSVLKVALSYPDLYEIGMCNLAIRILYNRINALKGISCERVFAPDRDLEEQLRARGLPLFSLESTTPLVNFDILGFSIGYELTYTNVLNILDLGGIDPQRRGRDSSQPIILAAGPAITNPAPMARFLDAVVVGEGEGWVETVLPVLARMKSKGAGRRDLLDAILDHPAVWSADKTSAAMREIWTGFGEGSPFLPIPNIRVVQDHGVVEIMRGCPNGCRFCHAGIFYRPPRLKRGTEIAAEADHLVSQCGYREITLSSLSSGDYAEIGALLKILNRRYRSLGVSFAVPSLRIDSMALNLLNELSSIRKSGLTFAVETPRKDWQKSINKSVSLEHTVRILREARKLGWNNAKFYFMLGLPVQPEGDEASAIVDFLLQVSKETGMQLRINLTTFIPKPHTPFQWERQIGEEPALEMINSVRSRLRGRRIKVGYHSPFASCIEGVMSRGDDRTADIIQNAFAKGARLDGWEEHFDWDIWRSVLKEADWDVLGESLRERLVDEELPWESVNLGVSKSVLLAERKRSRMQQYTEPCSVSCPHPCGVCGKAAGMRTGKLDLHPEGETPYRPPGDAVQKLLFSFAKKNRSIFYSHLDTMTIFERSVIRAGFYPVLTGGFNPKPRMEFASPLSVGISSEQEIATVEVYGGEDFHLNGDAFRSRMNEQLPPGISVERAVPLAPNGLRRSLMALYWGATYYVRAGSAPELLEEIYRLLPEGGIGKEDERNPANVQSTTDGEMYIVHRAIGGSGFLKFLTKLVGSSPLAEGLRIERMVTWADRPAGGRISYFELAP